MKKAALSAIRRFKQFHGRNPNEISKINFTYPKSLVYLGEAVALEYKSDKLFGGKHQVTCYRHKTGKGVKFYTDPQGKTLYVLGGKFKVTDWLRN